MIIKWIQAQAIKLLGGALLLALAAIPINGCVQYRKGAQAGYDRAMYQLAVAEVEASARAREAIAKADTRAAERAEVEAEIIADQLDAIERAEANDENPLDALLR